MYKYSLGGIVMHSGSNKLAVGSFTLMGYDFRKTESAYVFFSADKKIVSFIPKKEFEVPMAKTLLENNVKEVYNAWCITNGEQQVDGGLYEIYSALFKKVDKSSKEYTLAHKMGLVFDPEKEECSFTLGAKELAVA